MKTDRPYIICHMISTIDGKITGANNVDIFDDEYFELYTKTEDLLGEKSGWLLGRVTMQMFASKESSELESPKKEVSLEDYIAPHTNTKFMFGVDAKGLLRWNNNQIKLSNVREPLHLVIVVTENTPKEYLYYLQEKQISYLISGKTEIDLISLLNKIKENFGVEKLLLEGGGILNGSLMSSDLIDEISVVLTPVVVNQSSAPSLFENKNSEKLDLKQFSLLGVEKLEKDSLWLRYKKL